MKKKYLSSFAFVSAIIFNSLNFNFHAQSYDWHKGFGGTLDDEVFDITHDNNGNIYITGIYEGTADLDPGAGVTNMTVLGAGDAFFAKYDAVGNLVWVKSIGSIGDEEGQGIRVDNLGNIYLTGLFSDVADMDPSSNVANLTSNGGFDIYIAKYDNSGNYLWAHNIGSSNNSDDYPSKMALDNNGNLYVTGQFGGDADFDPSTGVSLLSSSGGLDVFFAKYDTNGNLVWANSIINTTNADDFGYNISLDANNNVYLVGQFDGTCDFDPSTSNANKTSNGGWDIFFAKYDTDGNFIWVNSLGGTSDDSGNSVFVDGSGNVYVTGYFMGSVDFDPSGNTNTLTSSGITDIFVGKYDNNGSYLFSIKMGGSGDDTGNSIALNTNGELYVTGQFSGTADFDPSGASITLSSSGSWDIFISKYDMNGNYIWAQKIGGVGVDQSHIIDILPGNKFLIAGEVPNSVDFDPGTGSAIYSSTGLDDACFAQYSDLQLGLDEFSTSKNLTVYPNPISDNSNLTININSIASFSIEIFTETGVRLFLKENCNGLTVIPTELTNGLYFLLIKSKEFSEIRKIEVLR